MTKLFADLSNEGLLDHWAKIFDWLFDDDRFSIEKGWSSGRVGAFAKNAKRLPFFGENTYQYAAQKNLKIPRPNTARKSICFIHANGSGEAKDIVRHIRNGVAHGNAQIYKTEGVLYIEIRDYSFSQKQTAYINMPLHYIADMYAICQNIESAIKHENNRKRHKNSPTKAIF